MEKENTNNRKDKSSWVIGGTTMIGLGVGLIFLQTSALIFVASLIIGIGAGLVIAPLVSAINNRNKK